MQKVLIIKCGWSETLDADDSGIVSLGDVLRSTVILHLFKHHHVTWLTDTKAVPLLKGNPFISRLLTVNAFTPCLLLSDHFDIIVNLEKDAGISAMADRIPAWTRYGFRHDKTGQIDSYEHSDGALDMVTDLNAKIENKKCWSQVLFEMMGACYNGEGYILGYQPKDNHFGCDYDIGLNSQIGSKFPEKQWGKWQTLYCGNILENQAVCTQPAETNLYDYMDWINSCKTIITNDSLGLHIALALGKRVIALFGPTSAVEVYGNKLVKLTPPDGSKNIKDISVESVVNSLHIVKCMK